NSFNDSRIVRRRKNFTVRDYIDVAGDAIGKLPVCREKNRFIGPSRIRLMTGHHLMDEAAGFDFGKPAAPPHRGNHKFDTIRIDAFRGWNQWLTKDNE